jgi:hypothetical protein
MCTIRNVSGRVKCSLAYEVAELKERNHGPDLWSVARSSTPDEDTRKRAWKGANTSWDTGSSQLRSRITGEATPKPHGFQCPMISEVEATKLTGYGAFICSLDNIGRVKPGYCRLI